MFRRATKIRKIIEHMPGWADAPSENTIIKAPENTSVKAPNPKYAIENLKLLSALGHAWARKPWPSLTAVQLYRDDAAVHAAVESAAVSAVAWSCGCVVGFGWL